MSLAHKQQHHEDFEVSEERRAIIRSDRLEFIGTHSDLEFDFGSFEVSNSSVTGIAIVDKTGTDRFTKSETYTASHRVDGVKVGTYQLGLVRKAPLPSGEGTRVAFELKSDSVPINTIQTVIKLRQMLSDFNKTRQEMNKIPSEFRRLTLEAKLFLQNLESQVAEMSAENNYCSLQELHDFENTLIPIVAEYITGLFEPIYSQLQATLKDVVDADTPICVAYFREQLKELIYQSSFAYRSVAKPLGYSGDYEMMNIIYRNEHVGDSLFGKCLHAYWLSHSEAKAVRNRSKYLYGILSRVIRDSAGAPLKIGSIACGSSREVQMIVESADEQGLDLSACEFHLLDQDVKALRHSHETLWGIVKKTNSPVKLNFINKAIRNVIARGWEENNFDLLYSAGLFDYFSDPVARMAAKALFKCLKPGGRLIIGNFNLTETNQFAMRLALDWSLICRSHDELKRLFGNLGAVLSVEQEPEGVNLFCVIRKPETV
jgi:extracellular factor (EF) 3-hydroxypalmitic acid methyl ester biosynthesis protein